MIIEDYKEVLQKAARVPSAAFQLFITTPQTPLMVFLFCEGEDDILFYTPIAQLAGYSRVMPVDCGNRHGVLTVFRMITQQSAERTDYLCFCDSDFDPFIPLSVPSEPRLFFTDGYSVECYFKVEEVFKLFLEQVSAIAWDQAMVASLIDRAKRKFQKFEKISLVISTYAIDCIRRGEAHPLTNISFDTILRLEKGKIVFTSANLDRSKAIFKKRHEASYKKQITELRKHSPYKYIRGKYHIRMIWLLLRDAYNHIRSRYPISPVSGRSIRVPASTHGSNFFETMSTRIAVPPDLAEFLKRNPPT